MNIKSTIYIILIAFLIQGCYNKPVSVDTPPLGPVSRDEYPKNALNAMNNGLWWGQCEVCGFPVTEEDIYFGNGEHVYYGRYTGYRCYRHEKN